MVGDNSHAVADVELYPGNNQQQVVELKEDHHTGDAVELHLAVDQQQQQEDEL